MIIMDLETTGLIRPGKEHLPGITQIGAIKYDADFNELDVFERDINPEIIPDEWEAGAIKLRGIGPAETAGFPTFFAVFFEFAEFVRGAKIWAGHNINSFDTVVLSNQLVRYGFSNHFPWPAHHLDTMRMVVNDYGKRQKLGNVYKDITGDTIKNAHEALADIRATAALLSHYAAPQVRHILGDVK
jgi:DNA polymerase III epsilon subunit-like protein